MPTATLVRLALLEARRGGLPWLALASVAAGGSLAAFLSQVAITESVTLQAAIIAALLRACAVFLVATHVISSVRRELDEKRLEMMLALPLSRARQYLGRLAGFGASALCLAAAFALPLLLWAPLAAVAAWALCLACESALVAAIALFFGLTLAQFVPAFAATAGFYLLSRMMPTIQLIAVGPFAEPSPLQEAARYAVDAVALLLPRLDAVTRTEWLLYGAPSAAAYGSALAGLILYGVLVVAAGLFDFYRRSL
jgi:ABC-type Na+ efflux pump permease subunit